MGCANARGRPGARMPTAVSVSAASAASSAPTPPGRPPAPGRRSRARPARARAGRPRAAGGRGAAGSTGPPHGPNRSRRAAASRWATRPRAGPPPPGAPERRPPVARWQASVKAGPGAAPSSCLSSSATPAAVSGAGVTACARRRPPATPAAPPARAPHADGRHHQRHGEPLETRQPGSSGTAATGCRPSARRPPRCTAGAGREVGAEPVEAVEDGERGRAPRAPQPEQAGGDPGRPEGLAASSVPSARAGSRSWRTTPKANSRSSSAPRERSTCIPSVGHGARGGEERRFAVPAGPSTTTSVPRPSRARASDPSIRARSSSRSRRARGTATEPAMDAA